MKVINLKTYGVVVFSSELTKKAIEKLAKHRPQALKLMDEEGNETFAISYGPASVSDYGVSFDREDSEGNVLVTISTSMTNEEVANEFAGILMNLKKVEVQAVAAYEELEGQLLEVANSIENPLNDEEGGNG